jgi:hypothetical protein
MFYLFRFCKQGTLQFCIIKPLTSFLVIILQVLNNQLGLGSRIQPEMFLLDPYRPKLGTYVGLFE